MIKITISYPVKMESWFDMDYYLNKHVPLSKSVFSDVLKGITIDCMTDENHRITQVTGALYFKNTADFYNNFLPAQEMLTQDAIQYTDITPILQISEIKLWHTPWEIGI